MIQHGSNVGEGLNLDGERERTLARRLVIASADRDGGSGLGTMADVGDMLGVDHGTLVDSVHHAYGEGTLAGSSTMSRYVANQESDVVVEERLQSGYNALKNLVEQSVETQETLRIAARRAIAAVFPE